MPFSPSFCDFFYILVCHLLLYESAAASKSNEFVCGCPKVLFSSLSAYRVQFRKKHIKKKIEATGACEAEPLEPQIKVKPLDSVDTGRGSSRNP